MMYRTELFIQILHLLEFPGKSFIDLPGMPLPTQTWNRESIFSAGGRMPFPFR